MKLIEITIESHEEMIDITPEIESIVCESRMKDGFIQLHCPGMSSAVIIYDSKYPKSTKDYMDKMNHFLPKYDGMHFTGHTTPIIKASLSGKSVTVPIEGGTLLLGNYQRLYFIEYAGPKADDKLTLSFVGSTLARDEKAQPPANFKAMLEQETQAEIAAEEEEKRLIEEMRREYAENARLYKENQNAEKQEQE